MNIEIMVKAIQVAKIKCGQCDSLITSEPKTRTEEEWTYFECADCGNEDSLDYIIRHNEKMLKLISVALMIEEAMKDD